MRVEEQHDEQAAEEVDEGRRDLSWSSDPTAPVLDG